MVPVVPITLCHNSVALMLKSRHVTSVAATCLGLAILAIAATAWAHGIHGDHSHTLKWGGPLQYMWIGAIHMLTGYDHLLFLLGVMFFLTNFKEIVTFITAFTIGHSVTLIGATLTGISANAHLIDAVIALSVIYKGFDNLDGFRRWIGIEPPHVLAMVFAFGLVHGFGLATRLQSVGLPNDGLVLRLLSFNVGVEIGQIGALIAMAALITLFRKREAFVPFSRIANGFLVFAGCVLFLHQLHGYQHNANPDDFGFSATNHFIDHINTGNPGQRPGPTYDMAPEEPAKKP